MFYCCSWFTKNLCSFCSIHYHRGRLWTYFLSVKQSFEKDFVALFHRFVMKKWPRMVHYPCTAPWLIVLKIELLLQERRAKLRDSTVPKMWKPEEQTLRGEKRKHLERDCKNGGENYCETGRLNLSQRERKWISKFITKGGTKIWADNESWIFTLL